ncbi:type II toxin-antitoxin system HicB family antitoxin (plasmid) [Spirillospora sp. CA-255316]
MRSHFEAIFDEPECDGDPDEFVDITFTNYDATITRTGKQWTVTVHDLPEGRTVVAQGPTWAEAGDNAHAAVTGLLGTEPQAVGIDLFPDDPEANAAIQAVVNARVARGEAEQAERDAVRRAARLLTGKGWSTRDTGSALRLSHQRISQLAPRHDS